MWRSRPQEEIATARTTGVSIHSARVEGMLVVAQIAMAMLLAMGAGLLLRSVANLRAIDAGVRLDGVAVIDTTMPTQLTNDERRRAVLDALPSLRALPGVRAVAASMKLPLRGAGQDWGIGIEGRPDLPESTTYFRIVTHDYFDALGIAVRRGRGFLPADREGTERVVVINEALAAKYFPGEDPLGRIVHTGFDDRGERIVGVVENVAEARLIDGAVPARYMLYEQVPLMWHEAAFVLAAVSDEGVPRLLQASRSALQRDARHLAIQGTVTMRTIFEEAVGAPRHLATLLSLLAGLALVLCAVGVYGMISHVVSRRMREYGICVALGLPPSRVLSQVMGRALRLVAAGCVAGLAAAFALTRLLSSLLYQVGAADARALGGAVFTLVLVGSLAALIPARRAARTDPAVVLREQ